MTKNNRFAEFIEKAYITYQARVGHRVSITDFARRLGVSQALVSHWMAGTRRPGRDAVTKVAKVLGPETYLAAGYIPDEPDVRELLRLFLNMPPEKRAEALSYLRSLASQTS